MSFQIIIVVIELIFFGVNMFLTFLRTHFTARAKRGLCKVVAIIPAPD